MTNLETATLGTGCFWCTETFFKRLKGVKSVTVGYSGGDVQNPSYEQVCTGQTGHAEAAQIKFNPKEINFKEILDVFWKVHDPTSLNRQGNDVGTQYRSVIFYHNEEQKKIAEKSKEEAQIMFEKPIVTELMPFKNFYMAEDYHQNFYTLNPNHSYCQLVIDPKLQKFQEEFESKIERRL